MKSRNIPSILILTLMLVFSCTKTTNVEKPLFKKDNSLPQVIRINLDGKPNMIALPINKEMYAAYDGRLSALHKVWKGNIKFTGPVYDNLHGPQPLSEGEAYINEKFESSPWMIEIEEERQVINAKFKSYQIKGDQVILKYELNLPSGEKIQVEEIPSFLSKDQNPGFKRSFTISSVPQGIDILLKVSFEHLSDKADLSTDGEWIESSFSEKKYDWGTSSHGNGILKLKSEGTTYLQSIFQAKATAHIDLTKKEENEEKTQEVNDTLREFANTTDLEQLAELGKSIIGKNDCAACHLIEKKVIGPSYTMIAQKYEYTNEQVDYLAGKILLGGAGVWGEQAMSAHPNVSESDAKAMVSYILSIVPDGEMEKGKGVVADFYDVGKPLASLPEIVAGQSPNVSEVYPNIDFRSGNPDIGEDTDENFSGFIKDFVMEVNCFLNVPETKTYDLQFIANNGGKLFIDGKLITQGHFYEGIFIDDFEIELEKGAHKINIEFYHHLFDKYLVLLWRDNKNEEYKPIPPSYYTHNTFDIKPTAPGIKNLVSNKAPGFGASLESVHPAFDLSEVRPQGFEPRAGDIEFRQDGRLVVCTWDGEVFEMENVSNKKNADDIKVRKIAEGLCEPLGITEVDGEVYVLQRWELTKLVDHDGDYITDEYVNIATFGNRASFHEWSFGLIYKEGYFYCTTGIAMGWGSENMHIDRGKCLKIAMDGSYSYLAHGLKEPNGIGFGPDGEIFVTENEGEWQPICQIFHIPSEGNPFYGNKSVEADNLPEGLKPEPPVIWLPQNEIGNSPSQPILMKHGPYEGQMIHGEITHGGIKRSFIEKIKGQYQGAVFRFSQGLEVGINRIEWGPDGALYASGLGGAQDFGHKGNQFGLQRLTYNGNPAFEMLAIRAKSNGLEIEFTKPLRIGDGTQPNDYKIQQWYYKWTHEEESQQKRDLKNLNILSVTLSDDRKKVFLELEGMEKEHVLYVQLQPTFLSENNEQLWSNESWYTLNKFPDEAGIVNPLPNKKVNTLTQAEIDAGWKLLFDGQSTNSFDKEQKGWSANQGQLIGKGQNSFILTQQSFENFELELEWKIESNAEGGILYRIPEDMKGDKAIENSLRMQLTDDKTEEAKNVHTRKSGANYDILRPIYVVTKPTNEYNHARLVVIGNQVEHWLNGIKILEYTLRSEAWQKGVANSVYANSIDYGELPKGMIGLYSKQGKIWFRNVRVKELKSES